MGRDRPEIAEVGRCAASTEQPVAASNSRAAGVMPDTASPLGSAPLGSSCWCPPPGGFGGARGGGGTATAPLAASKEDCRNSSCTSELCASGRSPGGRVSDMSRTCPGHVSEISRAWLGHALDISRTCQARSGECTPCSASEEPFTVRVSFILLLLLFPLLLLLPLAHLGGRSPRVRRRASTCIGGEVRQARAWA